MPLKNGIVSLRSIPRGRESENGKGEVGFVCVESRGNERRGRGVAVYARKENEEREKEMGGEKEKGDKSKTRTQPKTKPKHR